MSFAVSDIYSDAKRILGACNQTELFRKISDAVEVLSNSGDFDPLIGFLDVCVQETTCECDGEEQTVKDRTITLPREVDTVLAVNVGGNPAVGRDMLFRFHLNGMGDCKTPCDWSWDDRGVVPAYRDLTEPSKLVAFVDNEEDENAEVWVYGYDAAGKWIRTNEGIWKDGYRVPTVFGAALPAADAPEFARVTRIRKAETTGPIRVSSFDSSATTGTLLSYLAYDETNPEYRRIRINHDADWVRVAFRRRVYRIKSQEDLIPLPSQVSLLMMLRALRAYDENDLARGSGFEATARRFIVEAQWAHGVNTPMPLQVSEGASATGEADEVD